MPNWGRAYSERAVVWKELGEDEKAAQDLAKANEVADSQDPEGMNTTAWVLATTKSEENRNGKRALELAKKACEATGYEVGIFIDTLAAAYAETGEFDEAIKWAKEALKKSPPAYKEELEQHLKSFEAGEPWRE